jgi:DNA polymerase-1
MTDVKGWNDLAAVQNQLGEKNNLIIIDGNNLAYRWIQRKNYNHFEEDYIRTIESLGNSYKASRTIVCFDFGKSYYRMNISDNYKGTRKKPTDEEEIKKYQEFFDCLNIIYDELTYDKHKYRGIEADDLMAFLVLKLSLSYEHTWIISSDRDLYQLVNDNVSIFNIFSRREINLESLQNNFEITPTEYLLSRYIEGDKSDAIIGVQGIGPKRAQELAKKYQNLPELIKALPVKGKSKYIQNLNQSKKLLERNEQMINLIKYNKNAIIAGKDGEEVWKGLNKYVEFRN